MEDPVMTSASSHRLRSAVSACAQPAHSYFNSSYLPGTRIQCAAHDTREGNGSGGVGGCGDGDGDGDGGVGCGGGVGGGGGCIRKFHGFAETHGRNSLFDKLNGTKRATGSANEGPAGSCKRHKFGGAKLCLNQYCGFRARVGGRYGKGPGGESSSLLSSSSSSSSSSAGPCPPGPLNIYAGQIVIGNDLLSKLKLNRNVIDSKTLETCLGNGRKASAIGGSRNKCEKVIINSKISSFSTSSPTRNNNKNGNDGSNSNGNGNNNNSSSNKNKCNNRCVINNVNTNRGNDVGRSASIKVLSYYTNKCKRIKNKRSGGNNNSNNINTGNIKKNCDVLLIGKNVGVTSEINTITGGECYNCGVRDVGNSEDGKTDKQEISKWQPKHVVTRRTAQIVREIRNAWESRVGSSKLVAAENVQQLFNDLQLFPSASQVGEMLKCAQECSKNPPSKHLTFGEFYKFANDLIRTEIPPTSSSPGKILERHVETHRRNFTRGMSKYEVFLGGSCNPTTWRTDYAIPELENMNITYYNPQQVEEWRPELLEVEHQAKENATVMFFVIDNQTRGISTLIEVAHLAGNLRKLVLVIQSFTQKNQIIGDEQISEKEYDDLKTGQQVLQKLVQSQRIPVFDDIKVALKSTERILREDLTVQDLLQDGADGTTSPTALEVFADLDSGKTGAISMRDAYLALRFLHRSCISIDGFQNLVKTLGNHLNGSQQLDESKVDCELFLKLNAELERTQTGFAVEPVSSEPSCSMNLYTCDVYLGGTLENTQWRESIAVPMLRSENLSHFAPKEKGFTNAEAVALESSFVLLFVITGTARSISAMAIAGHYIGRGANVVLCVEQMAEGAIVDGEMLTDRAVKDYNRGRMYLTNIARRNGVAVFDEVQAAVEFAVRKCTSRAA